MIKVEVTKEFTLGKFGELKNIVRKCRDEQGRLFVGDTFECDKDMCDYLMGQNKLNSTVVKIIEIIPEKEEQPKVVVEEKPIEIKTPIKKVAKKKPKK